MSDVDADADDCAGRDDVVNDSTYLADENSLQTPAQKGNSREHARVIVLLVVHLRHSKFSGHLTVL